MANNELPDICIADFVEDMLTEQADRVIEGINSSMSQELAPLKESVEKNNAYAKTGVDPEFQRGENIYDRYYGDANVTPTPCLGPIDKPPYYAIEAFAGELGTKGGLMVDERARVVTAGGDPIPGLYAIGNCSSAVMGRSYPGAGATIGPATTFGYVAAIDVMAG